MAIERSCCDGNGPFKMMLMGSAARASSGATEAHVTGPLNPRSWVQARHRVSASGMGVRSAHIHREAAYIASVLFAAKSDKWDPNQAPGIREAITVYNGKVAPLDALAADPMSIILKGPLPSQHDLSMAIDDHTWKDHLATAVEFQRLRLTAQSGAFAGEWLNSVPSTILQTAFTSQEWTTQCRWWLGESVYPEAFPCPACGQDNDVHGYHALTCAKWGDRIAKHTSLCKEAARVAHTAFLHPQAERNVGPAGTNHRDADVLLRVWELGLPLAMDFAVTHTQQPANCTHAGLRPAGSWATEYARLHKSAGRERCAATNTPFAAMVVEVFGVWSPEAYAFLRKMAGFVARHTGIETHVAAKQLFSRMSSILQRCNVRAILGRSNPNRERDDDPLFAEQWPCRVDDVVVEDGAGDAEDDESAALVDAQSGAREETAIIGFPLRASGYDQQPREGEAPDLAAVAAPKPVAHAAVAHAAVAAPKQVVHAAVALTAVAAPTPLVHAAVAQRGEEATGLGEGPPLRINTFLQNKQEESFFSHFTFHVIRQNSDEASRMLFSVSTTPQEKQKRHPP